MRYPGREGTDADVLVPAAHADRLVTALVAAGWTVATSFRNGSAFEHAATLRHVQFGWADIHREFPGLGSDPHTSFTQLWADRHERDIAGLSCAVPSPPAQALILLLHAARSPGGRAQLDVNTVWRKATESQRAAIVDLVQRLDAGLGFAAAVGGLEAYRGHPEYALWRVASRGGTRIEEWWARIRAAPTWREALVLVLRAPLVNVDHLQMTLWRRPTRREIAREFFARPARGLTEELRAARARRTARSRL